MGRIIVVSSGKGGVGKTTLVSNLATVLTGLNYNVVAVDANLTTPNLGIQLGIPLYPVTIQNVINGDVRLKDATYRHKAGFKIVPADISFTNMSKAKREDFMSIFYELADEFDFVLIDSAAGLGKEARMSIEASDELITVVNPELQSLIDALKLVRIAKNNQTEHLGIVVNRVGYDATSDIKMKEIEEFLNSPIIGKIPEDKNVRRALKRKEPVVTYKPHAKASQGIKLLASKIAGVEYKTSSFGRVFSWLK